MKNKLFAISPLEYKKNELHFENIKITNLAKDLPTPFYLYSEKYFTQQYKHFVKEAHKNNIYDFQICYALKANPHAEILKSLNELGCGGDIVSMGELYRALSAKMPADKIIFSGVGKTELEIQTALKCSDIGVYAFNVESIEELELIHKVASEQKKIARVSFRLNPKVHAKTHKHISTGNKTHKFGITESEILSAINLTHFWDYCQLVGLSIHIGSQLTELSATKKALNYLYALAKKIKKPLEFVDVGGGLGIDYEEKQFDKICTIADYMKLIGNTYHDYCKTLPKTFKKPKIIFEPGRILIARSGVLVTRVIRKKESEGHHFIILDGGMNDLLRPSLYEAYHKILPQTLPSKKSSFKKYDVVGPICETSDCLGHQRSLPEIATQSLMVIADTGAYGHSMASNYNLRGKPAEYLLKTNGELEMITKKQHYSEI